MKRMLPVTLRLVGPAMKTSAYLKPLTLLSLADELPPTRIVVYGGPPEPHSAVSIMVSGDTLAAPVPHDGWRDLNHQVGKAGRRRCVQFGF